MSPSLLETIQAPGLAAMVVTIALGIGATHGYILGTALAKRFPRLQKHARIASLTLFILFLINAVINASRFASPEKVSIPKIFEAASTGEFASNLFTLFGLGTGFVAVFASSIMIIILILLGLTHIRGVGQVFVLCSSIIMLAVSAMGRFTDYAPGDFEVYLYFLYQLGISIGIVVGSRKLKRKFVVD